ncbi:MAG TPA: sigma factor, partial [Ilumatobacteraceae bacterium]|nr:sigma factor [Ilumatobacteraceae bacterium]
MAVDAEQPHVGLKGLPNVDSDARLLDSLVTAWPSLQRTARTLSGSGGVSDGDDLLAEAIARTLPRWRAGRVDDPAAYVYRTMVNLANKRWRR